jgi:hypothetical protein
VSARQPPRASPNSSTPTTVATSLFAGTREVGAGSVVRRKEVSARPARHRPLDIPRKALPSHLDFDLYLFTSLPTLDNIINLFSAAVTRALGGVCEQSHIHQVCDCLATTRLLSQRHLIRPLHIAYAWTTYSLSHVPAGDTYLRTVAAVAFAHCIPDRFIPRRQRSHLRTADNFTNGPSRRHIIGY